LGGFLKFLPDVEKYLAGGVFLQKVHFLVSLINIEKMTNLALLYNIPFLNSVKSKATVAM